MSPSAHPNALVSSNNNLADPSGNQQSDESPITGRFIKILDSSFGGGGEFLTIHTPSSFSNTPTRASRSHIPTQSATNSTPLTAPDSPGARQAATSSPSLRPPTRQSDLRPDNPPARPPLDQTSFYSDSSRDPSPQPKAQPQQASQFVPQPSRESEAQQPTTQANIAPRRLSSPTVPDDTHGVPDSIASTSIKGQVKAPKLVMSGTMAVDRDTPPLAMGPRNGSFDSGISTISNKTPPQNTQNGSQDIIYSESEVSGMIRKAGSPEAVIQTLLKEKNTQAQQNAQLWRLVDKQRAMILGLNKDLERALKDKDKYRAKVKEIMGNPAGMKIAGSIGPLDSPKTSPNSDTPSVPRIDISQATDRRVASPETPTLDSPQPFSPIDIAPYPLSPPAAPSSMRLPAVTTVGPAQTMPEAREHAFEKFDHDAVERAADEARKGEHEEKTKDTHYKYSLPPSRSLTMSPPNAPPPSKPPPALPTSISMPNVNSTTEQRLDEGLSSFPTPPRKTKAPPAPLQLQPLTQELPTVRVQGEDSDSELDDIIEVSEILTENRGRRLTRADDDRERELRAWKEAQARSASKKSNPGSGKVTPQSELISVSGHHQAQPGGDRTVERHVLAPPLLSPGLPASPRPGNVGTPALSINWSSPPALSPFNIGSFSSVHGIPSAPLSPRPPRQAIPLPPNTPLATPSVATPNSVSTYNPPSAVRESPIEPPKQALREPPKEPIRETAREPIKEAPKEAPKKARRASLWEPPSKTKAAIKEMINDAASKPKEVKTPAPLENTYSKSRPSPTERTQIFRGLITDEFPDLLLPPNALPSVAIRVASSRMKPSRASLISLTQLEEDPVFTLAVISRSDSSELWRVEKDSASLLRLDSRLKQCSAFTAKTPDRSLFSGHAPAKVDARRMALERYMEEVLNTPFDIGTAVELSKYLSSNTLPPNTDETGASSNTAREGSSHMIGPDGRPIRSGYLTKRGKNFGGWKSRFFLLDGPLLKYYETPGGNHLGTIKLQGAQIGKQSQSNDSVTPSQVGNSEELDNQYRHAFLILEPKKKDSHSHVKHVLCAENDRERDLWVDALLQWIDYRDRDEERKERPKTNGHLTGGGKSRKGSQDTKSHHKATDSETLVGVRYDSTNVGDAPLSARPKTSAGPGDYPNNYGSDTATPKTISGPKDPQPIADSAAWGNKPSVGAPPAPSYEEKKARKRSFFGFGPIKTRTNSDGQESIPTAGDLTTNPAHGGYASLSRQVFGSQLSDAVRYNAPRGVNVPLPSVVYRCIQYLDNKGAVSEEGIFRLSGSNLVIKQLRERFNIEGDINLMTDDQYYDIHAIASLLKLYLRELPTTILSRDLHMDFMGTSEITDREEKMTVLNELAKRLPLANATLLKYLIAFLIKIINNSDVNKMTVRNVGIVFSPTLNIPAPVFAMFLQNYERIFGIPPEEYELPTASTQDEEKYQAPKRPSTSGGSSSPHHHTRIGMESMSHQHGNRSTPTPPLVSGLNPARNTPTPPLQQQQQARSNGYDPFNHLQHYGQRPAYEAGYHNSPQSNSYNFQSPGRTAGYERPTNDEKMGGLQVQDSSAAKKRRESSLYMGNMQNQIQSQGSKSRLREETRY